MLRVFALEDDVSLLLLVFVYGLEKGECLWSLGRVHANFAVPVFGLLLRTKPEIGVIFSVCRKRTRTTRKNSVVGYLLILWISYNVLSSVEELVRLRFIYFLNYEK